MSKEQKLAVVFFVIGMLIILYLYYQFIPESLQNIVNLISIYGVFISFYGLLIAYIQIYSIKKISEITNQKVQETKDRISLVMSVSDISKAIKITEEAQFFLRSNDYTATILRLKDLKFILIYASNIKELDEITKSSKYNEIKATLFDDLNNLSDFKSGHKRKINHPIINSNIEHISTILIEFENLLKK